MPGFEYRKNLDGSAYVPSLLYVIAEDSVTFTIGDVIRINTDGFCELADATGNGIAGVICQVVDQNGKSLAPDSGTLHDYTTDSDNTTAATKKKKIGFIPALPNYLFYNDASGTLYQTGLFAFYNIASESQVLATISDTEEQFRLIELDPDHDGDLSKGLFQIVESQFGTTSMVPAATG